MALMFRSVLQNAGGAAELIVTCDSEFAGATISCSDGTTTLNKTCPSSSPYEVTFKIPNSGDWTISATASGTAYTSDPISVELDYTALLEYGFNWKRWVDTAQYLDSTDYNSLDEVLADELAVRELCLEHACVDYLAAVPSVNADIETIINNDLFAKWVNNSDYALDYLGANTVIKALMDEADKYGYGEWVITDNTTTPPTWGPKGNVPVMTSNTAPYGTAFAKSSWDSSFYPWKAFDGSVANNDAWATNKNDYATTYLGYSFKNPVCVRRVDLRYVTDSATDYWGTIKIQGSNDTTNGTDGTWTDIATYTQSSFNSDVSFSFDNDDYYLSLRVYLTDAVCTTNNIRVVELQFYGRELSVSNPAMTSNTAPYGEVIGTSGTSGYETYKAFDKSNSTKYAAQSGVANNYIGYSFVGKIKPMMAYVYIECAATSNKDFKIQGLNDDTWEDLADFVVPAISSAVSKMFVLDIASDTVYSALRLFSTQPFNISGQYANNIIEIGFYGLDYSEKEFEEGTNKKWLYDHGLELESINYALTTTTSTAINDGERIQFNTNASTANGIGTASLIDLSSYDLIRAKVGNNFYSSGTESFFYVAEQSSLVGIDPEASSSYAMANGNLPNNLGLNISSVNSQRCVIVYCQYGTRTQKADLVELWLE